MSSSLRHQQCQRHLLVLVVIAVVFAYCYPVFGTNHHKHLEASTSPYLKSHATDAIQWKPLSLHTLETARSTSRPIFLTSGYHACYWCYRLKKDTFSNQKLADLINSRFTPIIIDREVHTSEDTFLQDFMRETLGISGWPLMVILTPRGAPVYGYTYSKPEPLMDSLKTFLSSWDSATDTITIDAQRQLDEMKERVASSNRTGDRTTAQLLNAFLSQANTAADQEYGGFGLDEKYPWVPQMLALVDLMEINPQPAVIEFISRTVHAIRKGAITDQLNGGIFRYATSRDWATPHYEQMLYTQALVTKLFARTARLTGDQTLSLAALRAALATTDSFKLENNWYRSARSAVSAEGVDGGYYLWRQNELRDALGENWKTMVTDLGSGTSLILPDFIGPSSANTVQVLRNLRSRREQVTDDKVLLAWNGLVLSGFAGIAALDKKLYANANALAENLLAAGSKPQVGSLISSGENSGVSNLETLVYVAGGLLDWWQLTNDRRYAEIGTTLLTRAHSLFYHNGMWETAAQPLIGMSTGRISIPDSQLPSPSGEWLRLAQVAAYSNSTNSAELQKMAEKVATSPSSVVEVEEAFFHATTIAAKVVRALVPNNFASTSAEQ